MRLFQMPPVPKEDFTLYARHATLRDDIAIKAMQSMAASPEHCRDGWAHSDIAIQAYQLADAMLKAREA